MSRTVPIQLSGSNRSAAECVMMQDRSGTRIGFTTWDVPLTADIGTGAGDESFFAGMNMGSLTLATGFDAGYFEFSGPLGPTLTRADVNGGRWNSAFVWLFKISPDGGEIVPLMKGRAREPRVEGGSFHFEVRNEADRLNQKQGRRISNLCSADFGDAQCGLPLVPIAATVSAVTDDLHFSVTFSGTYADDYFNQGTADFQTGDLAWLPSMEVEDFTGGTGSGFVELFEPFFKPPQIGDTLTLNRGCSKLRISADGSLPTCHGYSNILNFRGFPEVPGSDQVLKYQFPGSTGV